jgi:2-polyprenyl-6-methoxyphenol hydroxylase-like FAD-dependent oxidoreductase
MLGLCRPGELVRWTGPEPFADLIFPLDFGGSDDHGRNPVTSAPVKVLVVGAGIGGLCLAQGLLRRGVDVAVYERDAALESRGQGYRLHLDAGAALHSCLAPDLYQLCVATAGRPSTSVTVVTKRLRRLRQFDTGGPSDPSDPATLSTSVNRLTFREILAARLDGVIEYGRACTRFEQDHDGVRVFFADGASAQGDVLVGADGVGSVVRRRYLPHAQVIPTGSLCVYGRTPLTTESRPLIPGYLWHGFTAVVGSGVGMATGVLDFREEPVAAAARIAPDVRLSAVPGYLMWALTGPAARFARPPAPELSAAALHRVALDTTRRWHRDVRKLVELATVAETTLVPIRTSVPVGRWLPSRVTLLGDAIHAMSPARGSGANTALRDAALLAAELGAAAFGDKSVLAAVADYEREMRNYGFAAVRANRHAEWADRAR